MDTVEKMLLRKTRRSHIGTLDIVIEVFAYDLMNTLLQFRLLVKFNAKYDNIELQNQYQCNPLPG